jgi:hypothetical protein
VNCTAPKGGVNMHTLVLKIIKIAGTSIYSRAAMADTQARRETTCEGVIDGTTARR